MHSNGFDIELEREFGCVNVSLFYKEHTILFDNISAGVTVMNGVFYKGNFKSIEEAIFWIDGTVNEE